jgi:hypothetical protein
MNLFGEGFPKEINKQIDVRQKIHALGYNNSRTTDSHLYKNANSAWCKLISSTNITNFNSLVNTNISTLGYSLGDDLARKFILFNGTSTDVNPNDRAGYGFGGNSYAYTSWGKVANGSADFGFRPMAGITGVSVKHKNRGTIRAATVNIKAWDKISFEIIDILYLRLGFSVLLEWGNSMYYDDNQNLLKNEDNSLADEFLNGTGTYYEFLDKIKAQQIKSFGNYDAMFGKVTNIHWSYQPDGSYDIALDLVSGGDIIESFKVKGKALADSPSLTTTVTSPTNGSVKLDDKDINKILQQYAKSSDIALYLYQQSTKLISSGYAPPTATGTKWTGGPTDPPYVYVNANKDGEIVRTFSASTGEDQDQVFFIRLGDFLKFIEDKILYKIKNGGGSVPFLKIDTNTSTNLMHAPDQLMSYDPRVCMVRRDVTFPPGVGTYTATTNTTTTPGNVNTAPTPLAGGGNYFVNQQKAAQAAAAPNFTQNPFSIGYTGGSGTAGGLNQVGSQPLPANGGFAAVLNANQTNTTTATTGTTTTSTTTTTNTAVNPNGTLGSTTTSTTTLTQAQVTSSFEEFFAHPYGDADYEDTTNINQFLVGSSLEDVGKIMNIYINFRFILTKLQELSDTDTNTVNLYDLLKAITSNINSAMGGYPKLDLWIDEEQNILKIIDQNPLPSNKAALTYIGSTNQELAYFNLTGYPTFYQTDSAGKIIKDTDDNPIQFTYGGFIRDFKFNTELTPDFATMITVSATSQGNVVGENNTALSLLNRGLKDRFKEEINGGGKPLKPNPSPQDLYDNYRDAEQEYSDFLKGLNSYLVHLYQNTYLPDEIDDYKSAYTVFLQIYKKYENAKAAYDKAGKTSTINDKFQPGTGFIPFNLSLTMDGLSGMKIGTKFEIDASYLPSNYPDTVDFLIKSLNHEIKDNQWTTTLESFCIAQGNDSNKTKTKTKGKKRAAPAPSSGDGSSASIPTERIIKTLTSGFDLDSYILSGLTSKGSWRSGVGGTPTSFKKTMIFLHHTAGWAKSDKGKSTIDGWNKKAIESSTAQGRKTKKGYVHWTTGAPYVMDRDGHVEQLADDTYYYITQGSEYSYDTNRYGIGIEVCNPGPAELKGGKWYALDTNISNNASLVPPFISGTPLGLGNGISYLVDENLNPIKWKTLWAGGGTYEYGVSYTPAQITGLEKLIRDLMLKHGIPFKWEGKKTYDQMFTKAGTYGNGGSNKGTPGVYTHTMVNPSSKADLLPTKEIVAMLQKFT